MTEPFVIKPLEWQSAASEPERERQTHGLVLQDFINICWCGFERVMFPSFRLPGLNYRGNCIPIGLLAERSLLQLNQPVISFSPFRNLDRPPHSL